jgi:hypothetical protein
MSWNRVLRFAAPLPCQAAVQGSDVEILPTMRGDFQACARLRWAPFVGTGTGRKAFAINYDGNPGQDGRLVGPALQVLRVQSW